MIGTPIWRLVGSLTSFRQIAGRSEASGATGSTAGSAVPAQREQRPPPTTGPDQDEDFFEKLRGGLEDLGIGSGHAVCILDSLEDRAADETALAAGELDSVLVLDEASRSCLVDLVGHIEREPDFSRSVAPTDH